MTTTQRVPVIELEPKRIERRRLRRRFWDVVTILVVGAMLFGSGYLIGHAHSRVIHRVEILYAV